MNKSLLTLVLAIVTMAVQAKPIVSPNERVTVETKGKKLIVGFNSQKVLEIPAVGFLGTKAKPKFLFVRHLTDDYTMLSGKRLHCTNEANEYEAPLGKDVRMVMRVYNDGIAFRYEFVSLQGSKVPEELTAFRIPEGTKRWMQQWTEAYEGFFPSSVTAKVKPERSFSPPSVDANGFNNRWGYPALIESSPNVFALITEANIERRQSASCLYNEGDLFRVTPEKNDLELDGEWHTPWRVVMVGSLADIVASTLVTDVSEPSQIADTQWIHPGVVSWVYWAYNHGSKNFDIIRKYVDLAVSLRLPYVLIDAEWDEMENGRTVVAGRATAHLV